MIEIEFVTQIDQLQTLNDNYHNEAIEHKKFILKLQTQLTEERQKNHDAKYSEGNMSIGFRESSPKK